jgi:hypothetical protein
MSNLSKALASAKKSIDKAYQAVITITKAYNALAIYYLKM